MKKQCIKLKLPNELSNIVNNAIELASNYDPNSRVRENAELFIKAHIVPLESFIIINDDIKIKINVMERLVLKDTSILLSDIMPCKIQLKNKYQSLMNLYLDYKIKLLTLFYGYFVCNDILNYLIWAYDSLTNDYLIKRLINDYRVKEKSIVKVLNDIFNLIICDLINYVLKRSTSIERSLIEKFLKDINNKIFILLKVDNDCIYVGLT